MDKLNAYHTHYEITDYDMGDCEPLEKSLSVWNEAYFRHDYKCHYDEDERILYVPRGYDSNKLCYFLNCGINVHREHTPTRKITFSMDKQPKNDLQRDAIRFMCGVEEYKDTKNASQIVVILPGGEGKTYCACAMLSMIECVGLIVVNTEDLKSQWKDRLLYYSRLTASSICDIDSTSKAMSFYNGSASDCRKHKLYITTHSILRNIIKNHGKKTLHDLMGKLGIGVKIIDEAHLDFDSTLAIDNFTNVYKTVYLTATFGRSDQREDIVFQRCFEKIFKFNKENGERRKHVVYIPYMFTSRPSSATQALVKGFKGFDKNKYIDYQLDDGKIVDHIYEVMELFDTKKIEGRTLIVSPKKIACEIFRDKVQEMYPDLKVCAHHSTNKVSNLEDYDVICATFAMLGTGSDIGNLRKVINTEPIRSKNNNRQLVWRLREYAPDKDTYFVDLIDKGFKQVVSMYNDRKKLYAPIIKTIKIIDITRGR